MSDQFLPQKYPPLPSILWSIYDEKPKFELETSLANNIKLSFRLYLEIISIYEENLDFNVNLDITFTKAQWNTEADNSLFSQNINYKKRTVEDWLSLFPITNKIWFEDLTQKFNLTKEIDQEYILNIKPFDIKNIKTIETDFDKLVKLGFLDKIQGGYLKIEEEKVESLLSKLCQQNKTPNILNNSEDISDIFDIFSELYQQYKIDTLSISSELFKKNPERFFLKLQNIINEEDVDKIEDILVELRKIWEAKDIIPLKIKYKSSSQKQTFELIIYPICLFYNQRIVYLSGYGSNPNSKEELNYYNYRLDNIEKISDEKEYKYLIPLKWELENSDIISQLVKEKQELQKLNSQSIYHELKKAFGVDIEKTIKTMLLRFPQDFHEGYIKGSKRHETFKYLDFNHNPDQILAELKKVLAEEKKLTKSQTEITKNDEKLIKKIVEKYPNDAYYTMNYRHGKEGGKNVEADVIMRLRAWCPNVEVLLPWDLRQRMADDMKKTWELYQTDKSTKEHNEY